MDVASRLDKAMLSAGFKSQSALARASGVPQATISRILKNADGIHGPAPSTLKRLASACRVTFDYLNEGRENGAPLPALPLPEDHDLVIYDQMIRLMTAYRQATSTAKIRILAFAEQEEKIPLIMQRMSKKNIT